MSNRFRVKFCEDGSATVFARVTARDGTGDATGASGEGNWLVQGDLSSITCRVFENGGGALTLVDSPTVTIASAVLDTPVTSNEIWTADTTGYNFLHDLVNTNFPKGGYEYIVEYTFTTTGGTVFHLVFEGCAEPILST